MPKKDYDYINKLTEYFLNNKTKFWSDDPNDAKVRSWLQQHYPRFIQYAYDNTPEDIRKTISPQKLGREFQKNAYMEDFDKRRQEGSNLALATIGRGVLAGAAAPLVAPLAGAGSVAEAGASAAGLAGMFGGAAVGSRVGHFADEILRRGEVLDTSNSLFGQMTNIDGSGYIGPFEILGGLAGGTVGGNVGSNVGSNVGYNIPQISRYRRWLNNLADLNNPETRSVMNNVIDFGNRQVGKFYKYHANGSEAPQMSLISDSGVPFEFHNGIKIKRLSPTTSGKYKGYENEIILSNRLPYGYRADFLLDKLNLEELKAAKRFDLAHETNHGVQKYLSKRLPNNTWEDHVVYSPKDYPGILKRPSLTIYKNEYRAPWFNEMTFSTPVIKKAPNADMLYFDKIDFSQFNKKLRPGKRTPWKASPDEFLSETRAMQQKLNDWNSFEDMNIENQNKIVDYLSNRFGFDKNYTRNLSIALGRNGFASGGSIHIDPSKKGTFTAAASRHGKSVQAFASQVLANKENYSPAMVKKANFARNAAKWHADGGLLKRYDLGGNTQDAILYDYFQNNDSPLADTLFIQPQTANTPAYAVKTSGDAPDPVYMPVVENPVVSQEPAFSPMEVTNRLKRAAAYAAATKIFQNTVPREVVNTYIRPQRNTAEPEYAPSEDLIQSLIGYEGFLERPSRKIDGKWTIGYGDTDKALNDYYLKNPNKKYNKAEAEKRLRDRVTNEFLPELKKSVPNWDRLTPQQKDSLLSYAYNVGKYFTSTHKNFVSAMKDFDIVRAAKELNAGWNQRDKSTGKLLYGLRKRRIREQRAFLGDKFSVGGVIDKLKKTYSGDSKAMLEAVRKARSETYEQM